MERSCLAFCANLSGVIEGKREDQIWREKSGLSEAVIELSKAMD